MAQNTNYTPTKKVTASGLVGAVMVIVVAVAQQYGVELQDWMLVALASGLKDAAAYMKREGHLVLEGDVPDVEDEGDVHEPDEADEAAIAARVADEVARAEAGEVDGDES